MAHVEIVVVKTPPSSPQILCHLDLYVSHCIHSSSSDLSSILFSIIPQPEQATVIFRVFVARFGTMNGYSCHGSREELYFLDWRIKSPYV